MAITTPMAVPSTVTAAPTPGTARTEPLTQATVSKIIDGIVVELREGYVFPENGARAADFLERH